MSRRGGREEEKLKKRKKGVKEQKKQGRDATTGPYKGDKGNTHRQNDKDNRKQEWSLCQQTYKNSEMSGNCDRVFH